MSINCNRCGNEILPLASYCNYCGAEAPSLTVSVLEVKPPDNPYFCPSCGEATTKDSFFCPKCGELLFDLPEKDFLFCPYCGTKNSSSANYCAKCNANLNDWFEMKGSVAEKLGIAKNIVLFEKMNETYYHFYSAKSLSIGRNQENDICLDCPWVSGKHALININDFSITDLQSANGTYVNRTPEKISKIGFDIISEFNIAGSFTFLTKKFNNAAAFSLTAVLDENECKKQGNMQAIDKLRNHYFILLSGDAAVFILKSDGSLSDSPNISEPSIKIDFINDYFYFSDNVLRKPKLLITTNSWIFSPNFKIIEEK